MGIPLYSLKFREYNYPLYSLRGDLAGDAMRHCLSMTGNEEPASDFVWLLVTMSEEGDAGFSETSLWMQVEVARRTGEDDRAFLSQ